MSVTTSKLYNELQMDSIRCKVRFWLGLHVCNERILAYNCSMLNVSQSMTSVIDELDLLKSADWSKIGISKKRLLG